MTDSQGWPALWERARLQHHAFDLRDAEWCGVAARQVQRRAGEGEIRRLHRGVYATPASADSPLRRASAALLAVRGHAVLAGRTAGALWGMLDAFPPVVELVRLHGSRDQAHRGVRLRHTSTMAARDEERRNRLPVTSAARTLADLAAVVTGEELLAAAASALQNRFVTVPDMVDCLGRMGTAAGVDDLREIIRLLQREGRTDSPFERDVRRRLFALGMKPYPGTYPLRVRGRTLTMLDIVYPRERVCIECDGRRWHSLPEAFHNDRARWNAIQNEGWIILYLTHRQFTRPREWDIFVRHLGATLNSR